jgi:hypothetical protein
VSRLAWIALGESTSGVLAHQRPRDRKISRILFLNKVKADAAVL